MDECPILLPEQLEDQVFRGHEKARQRVARRVAEHEQPPGSFLCRSQQTLVVRVTADDSVQHDDVGCLYAVGLHRDVVEAALRAVLERQLAQQPLRFFLISRGELEVRGVSRAAFQKLDLNLTDAAADLEHGRALDPALLEELDHPTRRSIKSSLSIARRHPTGKPRREERVATARIAAPGHSAEAYVSPAFPIRWQRWPSTLHKLPGCVSNATRRRRRGGRWHAAILCRTFGRISSPAPRAGLRRAALRRICARSRSRESR